MDDGRTFESGFILLDSLQHPPVEINGGKTVFTVCLIPDFDSKISGTMFLDLME